MQVIPKLSPVQLLALLAIKPVQVQDQERNGDDRGWTKMARIREEMFATYGIYPNEELVKLIEIGVLEIAPVGLINTTADDVRITNAVIQHWARINRQAREVPPEKWPTKRAYRNQEASVDLRDFDPVAAIEQSEEPTDTPKAGRVNTPRVVEGAQTGKSSGQRAASAVAASLGGKTPRAGGNADIERLKGEDQE